MRALYSTLLAFLLSACGVFDKHPAKRTSSPTDELAAQYTTYQTLAPRGWNISSECDALLFVSLQHVGLGEPGPVEEAQQEPGHWFRLPSLVGNPALCSSDISRDMFTGLLVWIWHNQRLDLAEGIWDYGEAHGWVMGQERVDRFENRTIFLPSMIGLLAEVIHRLGGEDHPERHLPAVYSTAPGFTSHLALLQIHLRGSMYGSIGASESNALDEISKHMAGSPLLQALLHRYSDGNQSAATSLLLSVWPSDRLPTSSDWTEVWRTQRSDGDPGLFPGAGDHQHPGGDFLFSAAVVLGRI